MKLIKTAFAIALLAAIFVGCSKDDPEPKVLRAPAFSAIAYDDSLKLAWIADATDDYDNESFQIFASKNHAITLANRDSFYLTTTPAGESAYMIYDFNSEPLGENDIYYYAIIGVAIEGTDTTFSPLAFAETSPVRMGIDTIYILGSDSSCAFNFENQIAVHFGETTIEPDFYFDRVTGGTITGFGIKSPHLAGSAWTGVSNFKFLGTLAFDEYTQTSDSAWSSTGYEEIRTGVFAIKTARNNFVKIKIRSWPEISDSLTALIFEYKYQTKAGYRRF